MQDKYGTSYSARKWENALKKLVACWKDMGTKLKELKMAKAGTIWA